MFKWLRDKINTGSETEYKNGLIRNGNFFHFMRDELPINRPDLIEVSHARLLGDIDLMRLMQENNELSMLDYSPDNMSRLLDLDMECRRIWGVTLKQSDLKYNKTFDPK